MPADMSRYPVYWPQIRAAILERAGHRCERCGVVNHAYRDADDRVWRFCEAVDDFWLAWNQQTEDGEPIDPSSLARKPARIVLTIAHIHDPNPTNCDPENLQALCQRCHNRLDAPMRARNAARTRAGRRRQDILDAGQQELLP